MNKLELEKWKNSFTEFLTLHWKTDDGAHDIFHLHRVWSTIMKLITDENREADLLALLAACYFHDYVSLPKNDPERHLSSLRSADMAVRILSEQFDQFPAEKLSTVHHAIHAHSFSANIPPLTFEAQVLQDADRMEALGAIGLGRMFYTAGKMNALLFDPQDPLGINRPLDDARYSIDHIEVKLLKLTGMMNTSAGKKMAESRAAFLTRFRDDLMNEIAI